MIFHDLQYEVARLFVRYCKQADIKLDYFAGPLEIEGQLECQWDVVDSDEEKTSQGLVRRLRVTRSGNRPSHRRHRDGTLQRQNLGSDEGTLR